MHEDTVRRLTAKLGKLRGLDRSLKQFGAGGPYGHGYRIQPVSSDRLVAREASLGITFPEEYRAWLLAVGTGAGPDYGLFPLSNVLMDMWGEEPGEGGTVQVARQITADHISAIAHRWKGPATYALSISADRDENLLIISESGCGAYTGILLEGPLAGKVFGLSAEVFEPETAGIGLFPEGAYVWSGEGDKRSLSMDPGRQFGFFAWYEDWLDRTLATYKPKRFILF